jgi:Tfp pilus assembly PilM family ATPase
LRQALRLELPALDGGEKGPHPDLAAKLRSTLAAYRWERTPAIVCISRAGVELRSLQIPPAPDNESAELVRNVLLREAGPAVETATVDFVAGPIQDGARTVLAALLASEARAQLDAQCRESELKAKRICLRPFGAAALARRRFAADAHTRLLIDASAWEADLTVLAGDQVVFCRTTRLATPEDDEPGDRPIIDEVRRTLVAYQNLPGGQRVDELVVCGAPQPGDDLAAALQAEFALPLVWLDPWSEADASFDTEPPAERGRFVALVGLLRDEADGRRPAIDFLNPRRARRAAPAGQRRGILIGALAAVVLAVLAGWTWSRRAELRAEIRDLKRHSGELDTTLKRAAKKQAVVQAVDQWQRGDRVWLDELTELSARFPKRRDAVVTRLSLSKTPEGAKVDLEGLVRDPGIVGKLEQSLRDANRQVQSRSVQEDAQERSKVWQFETSITVAADERGAGKTAKPPAKGAPPRSGR